MKFKSVTLIAVFLSCMSFNVYAQKWAEAIEMQQKKLDYLQSQIIASNEKILALNTTNFISARQDAYDLQAQMSDHIQNIGYMLTNVQIQHMLFEMITSPSQITKAKKLMQVRQTQLTKELFYRIGGIERQSKLSKDNETTRFIFETRDLVKSTQELINTNFKY